MNKKYLLMGILGVSMIMRSQSCLDGFETNSFAGWQGFIGTNAGNYSVTITSIGTASPNFGIETSTTIPCSNSTSAPSIYEPLAAPGFGQYSARLGEYGIAGGNVEVLTYSFVPSVNDTDFLYVYSTYLQAPGHSPADNPYFVVGMLDQNGDTIPGSFYMYQTGTPSAVGFDTSQCVGGLYFKPWTIRGVNLTPYVGQIVTFFAVNSDCYYMGHYAYSYIDIDCDGVLNIPAQSSVTLSAQSEDGATYLWNTGSTSPIIVVNNPAPNSMYTCTVTLPAYYAPGGINSTFVVKYKILGPSNVINPDSEDVISIFPNPADYFMRVKFDKKIKVIRILNLLGEKINIYENNFERIDVSSVPDGVYVLQVVDEEGKEYIQKFTVYH